MSFLSLSLMSLATFLFLPLPYVDLRVMALLYFLISFKTQAQCLLYLWCDIMYFRNQALVDREWKWMRDFPRVHPNSKFLCVTT